MLSSLSISSLRSVYMGIGNCKPTSTLRSAYHPQTSHRVHVGHKQQTDQQKTWRFHCASPCVGGQCDGESKQKFPHCCLYTTIMLLAGKSWLSVMLNINQSLSFGGYKCVSRVVSIQGIFSRSSLPRLPVWRISYITRSLSSRLLCVWYLKFMALLQWFSKWILTWIGFCNNSCVQDE